MLTEQEITVVFDNGGGMTLQAVDGSEETKYQHTFDDARELVACVDDILRGDALVDFDGNEAANGWLEPEADDIRNGGYRVMTVSDVQEIDPESTGWTSIKKVHAALNHNPVAK